MAKKKWLIKIIEPKDGYQKKEFEFIGTLWEANQKAKETAIKTEIEQLSKEGEIF